MFSIKEGLDATIRVGSDKAITTEWAKSDNRQAVGLWNGNTSMPFIKMLRENEKLFVRIAGSERIEAEFDLGKVGVVTDKIKAVCNWN